MTLPDTIGFVLNGAPVTVRADHPHLLAALREELDVISAKDGCAPSGQCGCCTVLVDGKARVACQTGSGQGRRRRGHHARGFRPGRAQPARQRLRRHRGPPVRLLHPGHPGARRRPAAREGRATSTGTAAAPRLGAHLCRCTGYTKIFDAVDLLASGQIPDARDGRAGSASGGSSTRRSTWRWATDPTSTTSVPRACCTPPSASPTMPAPMSLAIDTSAAEAVPGVGAGAHRRRRPRRPQGRADRPRLAGVHPGRRPHLLPRRRPGPGRGRRRRDRPGRRRPRPGRLRRAAPVRRPAAGGRQRRGRGVGTRRQRPVGVHLPPRRRRRRPRRVGAHRPRDLPHPAGRARLPRARVDPGRAPARRPASTSTRVGRASGTTATRSPPCSASTQRPSSSSWSPTAEPSAARRTCPTRRRRRWRHTSPVARSSAP